MSTGKLAAKPAEPPKSEGQAVKKENPPVVETLCYVLSVIILILTLPISIFLVFRIVAQYERAVILRLGRIRAGRARGPGLFFVLPCIDDIRKIDLRTTSVLIPPQDVLTKDSCTMSVDAVVFYRVMEPLKAVISISNYDQAAVLISATTLRNILGQKTLAQILLEREAIGHLIENELEQITANWGVKVEKVEIKDVSFPMQMVRAMAAEAEAARDAQAKVIAAQGELNASKALKEASDIISKSQAALQLRYLQTLANIASEQESTVIFPIPIDF